MRNGTYSYCRFPCKPEKTDGRNEIKKKRIWIRGGGVPSSEVPRAGAGGGNAELASHSSANGSGWNRTWSVQERARRAAAELGANPNPQTRVPNTGHSLQSLLPLELGNMRERIDRGRSRAVLVSRRGFHAGKPSSHTKRKSLKDMGTISPKSTLRTPLEGL